MEKMAYLGVEVGKVEDEGGTGGFPELVYEGYSQFPEGDIYGSFVTYQEEDMAIQWFSQVRLDYGDMGMGVDDVVDEIAADLAHGADGLVRRDHGAGLIAADAVHGDADGLGPAFLRQTGNGPRCFVDITGFCFHCSHRLNNS